MLSRTTRLLTPASSVLRSIAAAPRSISFSAVHLKDEKPMSQDHAVDKAGQTLKGGLDVQSKSVQTGADRAANPSQNPGAPHDTASQDKGGQAKFSQAKKDAVDDAASDTIAAQAGSFKDHRGGAQSTEDVDSGSIGGKTEASTSSFLGSAKQVLGLGTKKADHQENKSAPHATKKFSTSARLGRPEGASGEGEGSRKPVDTKVQGDQNSHLKHKTPGQPDSGKGNAAAEPHLPSKSSAAKSTRKYHSSARLSAESYVAATESPAKKDGFEAPPNAFPSTQSYEPLPPAPTNLTPSSDMPHSSTSSGARHDASAKAAVDGTLAERNPPPSKEAGEVGKDEAWKSRNAEQKSAK